MLRHVKFLELVNGSTGATCTVVWSSVNVSTRDIILFHMYTDHWCFTGKY